MTSMLPPLHYQTTTISSATTTTTITTTTIATTTAIATATTHITIATANDTIIAGIWLLHYYY